MGDDAFAIGEKVVQRTLHQPGTKTLAFELAIDLDVGNHYDVALGSEIDESDRALTLPQLVPRALGNVNHLEV